MVHQDIFVKVDPLGIRGNVEKEFEVFPFRKC